MKDKTYDKCWNGYILSSGIMWEKVPSYDYKKTIIIINITISH